MPYRRANRPTWYFMAATETGRKQLSCGTTQRTLARSIEAAWHEIADGHRAWDILNMVLTGTTTIGRLYDTWTECSKSVVETRRRLADVDVTPIVDEWIAVQRRRVKSDSADHSLVHVRHFFPANTRVPASSVTTDWLTRRINAYPGKRNTVRKVHSSVSVFLRYCADVKGIFLVNPMDRVARPSVEGTPIRFYESEVVQRIVQAQPTVERKVVFALMYGSGIEVSVALRITRSDVDPESRSIRASGTKAHTRDRVCRIADWAWDIVWEHARSVLPAAPLFPTQWDRHTVSDWHRQTIGAGSRDTHGRTLVQGLNLSQRYPLHCARDHWAVRAARAGTPIAVIQAQLGHGSPMLTLTKYGRFLPSASDRDRWEEAASRYDERRRAAK